MPHRATAGAPTVLFGAFDRHNFGDLLFPHVVARMLARREVVFAGLAARDLRRYGGHHVRAIGEIATASCARTLDIIHVGGELLTCDAWEAAVMLSPPDALQAAIASEEAWRHDRLAWAQARLGIAALAPYVLSRQSLPRARVTRMCFNAVGGVDLSAHDPALRAEVLAKLKEADDVSVRDRHTQALLGASGVAARLVPDPAVMVAELFGGRIRRRAAAGEVRAMRETFPRGYAAVQFSGDFGDDGTLDAIARQLDRVAIAQGLGVALFRAGAAPWHDDLACYRRVASRVRGASVALFDSLDLWDICALIAHSRVYCGSSLHGRIVAMAFALPRVNVSHPAHPMQPTKQAAFAQTWEPPDMPAAVGVQDIADAVDRALAADRAVLARAARELADRYREGFRPVSEGPLLA
ncbi:Polysaccharide pyruvyl transferase [Burkholderia multivorans]